MGCTPIISSSLGFFLLLHSVRETGCRRCCVHAKALQRVLQILLWSRVSKSTLALAVSSPKIYEMQVVKANFKMICNQQFSGVESPELRICLQTGCENVRAGAGEPCSVGLGAPAAQPLGKGPAGGAGSDWDRAVISPSCRCGNGT